MPDPALLALMQHFASPPPAIVQAADIVDAEPFLSALEAVADDQDRELRDWLIRSEELRGRLSSAMHSQPHDFPSEMFDDLIFRFEHYAGWERRAAAKRDRLWRRRPVSARMRALQGRMASRSRSRLVAVDELALFLRAMRAECDPDSRGGATFDDPDALERHLLGALA